MVATAIGVVDATNAPALHDRLQRIVAPGNLRRLVIDLSRVESLDRDGLRCLAQVGQAGIERGIHVCIVAGSGAARRAIDQDSDLSLPHVVSSVDDQCHFGDTRPRPAEPDDAASWI